MCIRFNLYSACQQAQSAHLENEQKEKRRPAPINTAFHYKGELLMDILTTKIERGR